MRKSKRKQLAVITKQTQRCITKFETLDNAYKEYGIGAVRKLRDRMSSAGVGYEQSSARFSTAVRGKEKRKGSSKQPMGYPSVNSQFGRYGL